MHALMHAVVKGERCHYSMTAMLECVSIVHQATLCDGEYDIRIFTLSTQTIVEDSNDEFLRITNVSMCNVCC